MTVPYVLIKRARAEEDTKLGQHANNGRKVCATSVMEKFGEIEIEDPKWNVRAVLPTGDGGFEVATFSEYAGQDRHKHGQGTEIYTVLKGTLQIRINEDDPLTLETGDEIVILPGTVHEIVQQKHGSAPVGETYELLVRVHSLNCRGADDKYVQLETDGDWVKWSDLSKEDRTNAIKKGS